MLVDLAVFSDPAKREKSSGIGCSWVICEFEPGGMVGNMPISGAPTVVQNGPLDCPPFWRVVGFCWFRYTGGLEVHPLRRLWVGTADGAAGLYPGSILVGLTMFGSHSVVSDGMVLTERGIPVA